MNPLTKRVTASQSNGLIRAILAWAIVAFMLLNSIFHFI